MTGFCDTGEPQHRRHWPHATMLVSISMLRKPHAGLPTTAGVDEAVSPGSHWFTTDRRCNQVAGPIVFPTTMTQVCCNFNISKSVNLTERDITQSMITVPHMNYEVWKWDPSNNQKIWENRHSCFPLQLCWLFRCWTVWLSVLGKNTGDEGLSSSNSQIKEKTD
jgi:hypothetical protein